MVIAAAVVSMAEILLSWNFEHIVKMKTKRGVNAVNMLEGLSTIEICAPWEVI